MRKFLWMLIVFPVASLSETSDTEKAGEIFAVALPLGALGLTFYEEDREGRIELVKSVAVSALSTLALKEGVDKTRPDGDCCDSFPSGHTSTSFVSAAFVHRRYGAKRAIPAYVLASYVGYSRVEADRHFTEDVIAGAIVGFLSGWFLSSRFENTEITPVVQSGFFGLHVSGRF